MYKSGQKDVCTYLDLIVKATLESVDIKGYHEFPRLRYPPALPQLGRYA